MVDSVSPLATAPAAVGSDADSESDATLRVLLEKAIVKLPGELNDTAPAATMSIPCPVIVAQPPPPAFTAQGATQPTPLEVMHSPTDGPGAHIVGQTGIPVCTFSAPAAGSTEIEIEGFGTVPITTRSPMYYEDAIALQQGLKYCRELNDHSAAHKFFRHLLIKNKMDALELGPEGMQLPEIAHSFHGSE